jgi:hypothetical protein
MKLQTYISGLVKPSGSGSSARKRSCHDLETPEGLLRLREQLDQAKALLGSLRLARSL